MEDTPLRVEDGALRLHVWVVAGASRSRIVGPHDDKLKVAVSSPPEAGLANREASALLTAALGTNVELIRGMRSRHKVFAIDGPDVASVKKKLGLAD